MTDTVISSATKEVVIGTGRPFVVIGERINPTGRKLLAQEMKDGDFSRVEKDALAQVEAGAHMLDVNAGIPLADEPALMTKTVELVQSLTDVPLCIDSSVIAALEAVLPLVKRHGCAVVAISNDDTGISQDINVRFDVAKKIVERASDHGIPKEDVVVDPLVMPVGAVSTAGKAVLELVHRLRTELGVNTTCGASNLSFGLPNRNGLNSAFLSMAIAAGMTSSITNPLHDEVMMAIRAADVVMATDKECMNWLKAYRPKPPAGRGRESRRG
jgi:5-methyltetrahydrofolate--homocysteine methyltransferase